METVTLRIPEELLDELDEEADEHGVTRSEYVRETLVTRHEHTERIEELETDNERLQRRVQTLIDMHEQHDELVRYAEETRSLQRQKATASLIERARWWVWGMSDDEENGR